MLAERLQATLAPLASLACGNRPRESYADASDPSRSALRGFSGCPESPRSCSRSWRECPRLRPPVRTFWTSRPERRRSYTTTSCRLGRLRNAERQGDRQRSRCGREPGHERYRGGAARSQRPGQLIRGPDHSDQRRTYGLHRRFDGPGCFVIQRRSLGRLPGLPAGGVRDGSSARRCVYARDDLLRAVGHRDRLIRQEGPPPGGPSS
jgi:hypothetical protein